MGDNGYSYVNRALVYAQNNAGVIPANLSLVEAVKDLKLVNDVRPIYQQISQLTEALDDTMMAAGVEAKDFADKFYALVKLQAQMNVPAMDVIADDLGAFYDRTIAETTPTVSA